MPEDELLRCLGQKELDVINQLATWYGRRDFSLERVVGFGDFNTLEFRQRCVVLWFWGAVAISALLVLALPFHFYFPDKAQFLIRKLLLTWENNLGAWWSGILLFMLAVHAFDLGRATLDKHLALAWKLLAGVFLFLSADEMGSMHERISLVSSDLGWGRWTLLVPVALVLAGCLSYTLVTFWRAGDNYTGIVVGLVVGFGFFATVVLQEHVEHLIEWRGNPLAWMRDVAEEGAELAGMLVLLFTVLRPYCRIMPSYPTHQLPFASLTSLSSIALLTVLLMVPAFAEMGDQIQDRRGQLSTWLACVVFVGAGLSVLPWLNRWRGLLIPSAACIGASLSVVFFGFESAVSVLDLQINLVVAISATAAALCLFCLSQIQSEKRSTRTGLIAVGAIILLVPMLVGTELFGTLVAVQALAVLSMWATASLASQARAQVRR